MSTPVFTHAQVVTRLYRQSLKHMMSWIVQRELFNDEAMRLRAEFRSGAAERDPTKIRRLVESAQERLNEHIHPDLYTMPAAVGGSKYMRNPEPFHEVVHHHQ
jgi:NADH dehydrogenase (ubiquinone) 1 beta subcomplex subunit 9